MTSIDNRVSEYIIVTDEPDETDMDIKLTERYAIHLDFQWLWNERISPGELDPSLSNNTLDPQLTPWFTCKYRF